MASIISAGTTSGTALNMAGDTSGVLQLATNGSTTALTVDTSQNVGIGTTSPTAKLQVARAGGSVGSTNLVYVDVTSSYGGISINSTANNNTFVELTEAGTKVGGFNADTTNNVTSIQSDGGHVFAINTGGTTERMRIDTSGFLMGAGNTSSTNFGLNWGGGKTTTAFNCAQIAGAFMGASGSGGGVDYPYVGYGFYTTSTNGTYKYSGADVVSAIRYSGTIQTFTGVSGTAGNNISWVTGPYVALSGTSWTNSSDERLKNITGEITDAINKVSQLRAAEFTWKSDESNKPQVGLIAQDVQKVLPEVVVVPEKEFDGTSETAIGVNYDQVIPLLVAAIKEQQTIINDLKARITALEGAA